MHTGTQRRGGHRRWLSFFLQIVPNVTLEMEIFSVIVMAQSTYGGRLFILVKVRRLRLKERVNTPSAQVPPYK